MKQALLVIDVQNDYFPGGKMELDRPQAALARINQLETHFQQHDWPIIYIQHIKHERSAAFFEAGTVGVELHAGLQRQSNAIVIEKHFPNSFYRTNLAALLYELGAEQIVICGMMTQMCVDSTTRAGSELQFHPIVISDATAAKKLDFDGQTVEASAVQTAFLASLSNFAQISSATVFLED